MVTNHLNPADICYPSACSCDDPQNCVGSGALSVVAALECEGYFLIASDSEVNDKGFKTQAVKLYEIPGTALCYGTTGLTAIAADFQRWINQYFENTHTWEDFKSDAETKLAHLNGNWRRLQQESEKTVDTNDITTAIIVGYIDGDGRMLSLKDDSPGEFMERRYDAIGSGEVHALVARTTLTRGTSASFRISNSLPAQDLSWPFH